MRTATKGICVLLTGCIAVFSLFGCQKKTETVDFSNAQYIAELATLECYYHNVAKFDRPADGFLFGIGNIGYKKMWFEYSGIVKIGLDASKVKISNADANGVVTITIPQAEVLGEANIDESTISEALVDTGMFTEITAEEKMEALAAAQDKMEEAARNDDKLLSQARERAKIILEQYVVNMGNEFGQSYTVVWENII